MRNRWLGMRTIKTALVVFISFVVSSLINDELSFALIYGSVIAIETSVVSSVKTGYNRILGTAVGGVIGLIMTYVPFYGGLTLALGVVVTILVGNLLDIKKATGIAITLVIIIIIGSKGEAPAVYALQRTLDTLIGILIATVVNLLIYPPDQMKRVRESFHTFRNTAKKVLGDEIEYQIEDGLLVLAKDLENLKTDFDSLDNEISLLRKYDHQEFEYYKEMVEVCDRILIYAEALSLSEQGVRMTQDNHGRLIKILQRDIVHSGFVTPRESTRDDLIYNYNLAKLIGAMEKVLRNKVFQNRID